MDIKICGICGKEIKEGQNYSVIKGTPVCRKCLSNNTGQINIGTGNSTINCEQNIYIDKKKG